MSTDVELLRWAASGIDLGEIAKRLEVPQQQAATMLAEAASAAAELGLDADGSRELELEHLDLLRRTMLPIAMRGDIAAARVLVRIHHARAALLGLVDTVPDLPVPETEEVNELAAIRERREARRSTPD